MYILRFCHNKIFESKHLDKYIYFVQKIGLYHN